MALTLNPKNPRRITPAKQKRLADTMERLGDIGGIILNKTTGTLIGGNQRTAVIGEAVPVITERFKKPTKAGTTAIGFVEYEGERFTYREVKWTQEQEKEAIIAANVSAGEWDFEALAMDWKEEPLAKWGLTFPVDDAPKTPDHYSRNPGAVQYEPKNTNHKVEDLFVRDSRFDKAIDGLHNSGLKELLKLRAAVFTSFNYSKIADYYAYQATQEEKLLIEQLALVLLDRDNLIKNGFADLLADIVDKPEQE